MSLYFSAVALAFFDDAIHSSIPDDAVEISADRHAELMAQQATGKIIAADVDGLPTTVSPPPPTPVQLMAALRRRRDRLLAACDHTQMPDFVMLEEQREAWRTYRQALRDLPETVADLSVIDWPTAPIS